LIESFRLSSSILVADRPKGQTAFLLGFVGDSEVFEKHPTCGEVRWDETAAPELQMPTRQRRKRVSAAPRLPPTKESDVYALANLLTFFWDDEPGLRLATTHAQEPGPDDRSTIDIFRTEFIPFRDHALTDDDPPKEAPLPAANPPPGKDVAPTQAMEPTATQLSDEGRAPAPRSQLEPVASPAHPMSSSAPLVVNEPWPQHGPDHVDKPEDPRVDGFLPIGWMEQFGSRGFRFGCLRAEIVVEVPKEFDESELFVVDPDNLHEPGFPFVAIRGSENGGENATRVGSRFCAGIRGPDDRICDPQHQI
jgi:hypothetical protein